MTFVEGEYYWNKDLEFIAICTGNVSNFFVEFRSITPCKKNLTLRLCLTENYAQLAFIALTEVERALYGVKNNV